MSPFTAAVVGLGRIGQGYDYEASSEPRVLTHATAFGCHPAFTLVAGVDPDARERRRFTQKFQVPAFEDVAAMLSACRPDVIALCTPTQSHYPVFKHLMTANPRALICEKPLAERSSEGWDMVRLANERNCALLVNYMRRFEPGTRAVADAVKKGSFGEIYKGIVWYSKGLLNNGSHFIDLLCFMMGDDAEIEYVRNGRHWSGSDPEPDCCLRMGTARIYLLAAREECYSMHSMELVGTKGMIKYMDGGNNITVHLTAPDPLFAGYTALDKQAMVFPSEMNRYQWHVLEALRMHLESEQPLASDGHSALRTLSIVESILSHCSLQPSP